MIEAPTVPYWHLWTGTDGISRQTRCVMTEFEFKSMKPPADPQWQGKKLSGGMSFLITVQPVGWIGTWHENPKPQWIVPLSGRWFVESMDGTRIEMGCGEISFGGDQNCREVAGRRGHLSGTMGNEPAVLLVVQLDDAPRPALACVFR